MAIYNRIQSRRNQVTLFIIIFKIEKISFFILKKWKKRFAWECVIFLFKFKIKFWEFFHLINRNFYNAWNAFSREAMREQWNFTTKNLNHRASIDCSNTNYVRTKLQYKSREIIVHCSAFSYFNSEIHSSAKWSEMIAIRENGIVRCLYCCSVNETVHHWNNLFRNKNNVDSWFIL